VPEPFDLIVQQLHARAELLYREQREVLSDFMRDFLFRFVVLVDRRHDFPPAPRNLAIAATVVTSMGHS